MYARTLYGHVNDRNTLWLMTALVSIFVLFLVIFNPLFTYISEADSTEWYFDIGRL